MNCLHQSKWEMFQPSPVINNVISQCASVSGEKGIESAVCIVAPMNTLLAGNTRCRPRDSFPNFFCTWNLVYVHFFLGGLSTDDDRHGSCCVTITKTWVTRRTWENE